MSVDGVWKIVVKGPTGAQATVLTLKTVDGVLTGTQSGQGQSSAITDTKVDGNSVFWVNNITSPMKMKVEFTATVDGGAMTGKCKAGFMGSFPFTGTKEPG